MKLFLKKILTISLSFVLLSVGILTFTVQAREGYNGWGKPYPGDINFDYYVDATDALLILQWSTGIEVQNMEYRKADVNGDGSINAADALEVLQYSVYIKDRFTAYQSLIC